MHVWFRWIFYLNPGAYAFESLMANVFGGLELQCQPPQLIPFGPGYEDISMDNQGCTVLGSDPSGLIHGETYVAAQYHYSTGHIWRGFGVLIGFWIFFIGATSLAFELRGNGSESSTLLYKRPGFGKKPEKKAAGCTGAGAGQALARSSTFSWHNLDYFVKHEGQQKQLLDKVFGYVQPGNLVALMGCSGAGKTTYATISP